MQNGFILAILDSISLNLIENYSKIPTDLICRINIIASLY